MGDNTQFVKCIEQYPCIYNHNDNEYLKRDVSDKAWQEVSNEMQLSVSECKEKWKNLRYGLIRSLRLNADGTPKRKYYLRDDMEFLLPYLTSRQYEMSPLDVELETDEDRIDDDNDNDLLLQQTVQYAELELTEPVKKKTKKSDPINSNKHLERLNESHDDSRRMFLLGLMPEINALTNFQMRVFRRRVLALLDEVAEGRNECASRSRDPLGQEQRENTSNYIIKMEPS